MMRLIRLILVLVVLAVVLAERAEGDEGGPGREEIPHDVVPAAVGEEPVVKRKRTCTEPPPSKGSPSSMKRRSIHGPAVLEGLELASSNPSRSTE